jgi:predicted ATPase/DNA-binding SARP family transcriptional activator
MLPETVAAEAQPTAPGGLPAALTRLIGREEAVDELLRLLAGCRLLTLTGPGGSGKTRLAMELSQRVAATGRAVTWVDLAAVAAPEMVAPRVAAARGIREHPERTAIEALIEVLGDQAQLLVLDNCEHLVEAIAELVERLLGSCGRLVVLTTSREALRMPGERAWLVPPLTLPDPAADLATLAASSAIQLFAERAAEGSRSFALDAANAAVVARICRRLDGLPLAIELAAARVGLLALEQIADRLDDAFRLLSQGPRRAVPRHRTLRAAIDWSYSLLTTAEQRLLARLAVFTGGFTLEAAETVGVEPGGGPSGVLDDLAALVGKSLVLVEELRAVPRYRLLETVRQYALERLREAGEAEEERARRRHADVYLALARQAEPYLMAADLDTLERLDADHDNVRSALAWSRAGGHDEAVGLPLAAAFHWYWYYRVLWAEGLDWLEGALAATDATARTAARAGALRGAGAFSWYRSDVGRALALLAASAEIWRELGDRRQLMFTLALLAQATTARGDLDEALRLAEEAVTLARESRWCWDVPYVLTNALAFVHQRRGDLAQADAFYCEAEAGFRALQHRLGLPFVLNALARLALSAGDGERAASFARQALASVADSPDPWFASRALRTLAYSELLAGHLVEAARLLGASEALLRSIGARVMPFEEPDQAAAVSELRRGLTAAELDAAMHQGRTASFATILERALGDAMPAAAAPSEPAVAELPGWEAPTAGPLHVRGLGPLEVALGDRLLTGGSWGATRAKELLFLLACHPQGRTKEQVGAALWPEASPGQVHNSFHVTLHRLRRALGDGGWIVLDGDRYRLDPRRPWELDGARFDADLSAALAEDAAPGSATALGALEGALASYRGPLFDSEEVGDWHLELRDRLQRRFCDGLVALGRLHSDAGRHREAVDAFRRLLAADELHEEGCRGLMTCLARLGERAQALRVYRDLASRLWDELGTDPSVETTELFERLQAGDRL